MKFKEMSNLVVKSTREGEFMNLHEECLLKYLLNPMDLNRSTELLQLNNSLIEKGLLKAKTHNSKIKMKYSVTRV